MKALQKIAGLVLISIISIPLSIFAQMTHNAADHIMVMPKEIKWEKAPPSLPEGAWFSVIEGNPAEAGLFTMRIKMPPNYVIKPHTHPTDEHVTVLQGAFYMGLGASYDAGRGTKMDQGGFAVMKTGTQHFAFTKGTCIIQLHGMGPWGITYVNPVDDPRNKK